MRAWRDRRRQPEERNLLQRGADHLGKKRKKKGCCLFDCVKATSSFMLIPIISEGEGATVAD